MKKRMLSLLLVLTAALTLSLPIALARVVEAPEKPIFAMRASADVTGALVEGDQFTVGIYGEPLHAESEHMMAFQFALDYPAEALRLISLTASEVTAGNGFVPNAEAGRAVYNAMTAEGVALKKGGTLLASAVFEVLPTTADRSAAIGLTETEITRPQDMTGHPLEVAGTAVQLHHVPMLALPESGTAADTSVEVTLHENPAGTLLAAVYSAEGQMLRSAVKGNIPANAGVQQIPLSLTGGRWVKVYLLDAGLSPLCPAAQMPLK